MIVEVILAGLLTVYLLTLLVIVISWITMKGSNTDESQKKAHVTVIIPFRNEVDNLPDLIEALKNQENVTAEYLFINDHSEDGGETLIPESDERFKLFNLSDSSGKKSAITMGVNQSSNENILTIDADTTPGKRWAYFMALALENGNHFVSGPVKYKHEGFWSQFQSLEFSALIGVGAATIHLGFPTMANAANMAFKKEVFFEVNGYVGNINIPTGDDEFLLKKISKNHRVEFLKKQEVIVTTQSCKDFDEFSNQRIRWASKWKFNNPSTPIIIFLLYAFILVYIISSIIMGEFSTLILSMLTAKVVLEMFYVLTVGRFLMNKFSYLSFLIWQILYPFYALYFGILSNFTTYSWKGRRFN